MKYVLAFLAMLYALIPYDILPDFAIGWGWIDDLVILWLLWRFFKAQSQKKSGYRSHYYHQTFENQQKEQHTGAGAPFDRPTGPKDPYTVLNIDKNASHDEIKHAYRELASKYHPDKVQHLGEEFRKMAEERFKEIEEAYRELMPK